MNVAGVLAGYGISSAWVSKVGDDGFGRYLVQSVAERGIDVDAVALDGTRSTGIYVKERGGTTGAEDDLARASVACTTTGKTRPPRPWTHSSSQSPE